MYYEEKVIDGVLCFRGTPNGDWQPVHAKSLTDRVVIAERKLNTFDQARTLKPCPFCGSTDIDAEFSLSSDGSKNAGCMSCGAVGPDARGTLDHISTWDMRARLTTAQVQEIEERWHFSSHAMVLDLARLIASHREVENSLDSAEDSLRRKGYRKSCDILACNCGDQWNHGGLADERLREIRDALPYVTGKTILARVEDIVAEVTRLRTALQSTQWKTDQSSGIRYCPWCTSQEDEGHKPNCFVGKALTGQEAKEVQVYGPGDEQTGGEG